jgi:MoxR-like ATPase
VTGGVRGRAGVCHDQVMNAAVASPADLRDRLASTGYLCDEGLATIAYLTLELDRPLLLEGEPGTGKTALAEGLAEALEVPLIRLQCFEGIDASQALYDWDFPRQILHLRTAEAATRGTQNGVGGAGPEDVAELERSLYSEKYLVARPVLRALRESPCVLLVDEIDRADSEFEAFLLEVLATHQITVPELGTIRAEQPPVVVLTSNRTRELHDALKRRCLYHWIEHPGMERELAILRSRAPEVSAILAEQVVRLVQELRRDDEMVKPPGVSETLEWARALHVLGLRELDPVAAVAAVGAVAKHHEDAERVRRALGRLVGADR